MKTFSIGLAFAVLVYLLSGCEPLRTYNSHVGARQIGLTGYAKDDRAGGAVTYRVEYR